MAITVGAEGSGTLTGTSETRIFQQQDDIPVTALRVIIDSAAGDVVVRVDGMHKTGATLRTGESEVFRLGHGGMSAVYVTGASGDAIRWYSVANSITP